MPQAVLENSCVSLINTNEFLKHVTFIENIFPEKVGFPLSNTLQGLGSLQAGGRWWMANNTFF